MAVAGWVLAIDFGTSYTTVAVAENGRIDLIEIDGVRAVPSGVWLDGRGVLVVGMAAERQARLAPERWERAPKRLLGEVAPLLLGGREIPVVEAVAAVLRHVAGEAMRQQGTAPAEVRLTHPARWSGRRLGALQAAASIAGLGIPVLAAPPRPLPEPVAAAIYFADRGQLPAGAQVAVYDLGGGTFDTTVLTSDGHGYAVRALGGLEGYGGESFDALLYAHVGRQVAARDPAVWNSLQEPPDARWRRAGEDLYREVRRAKEDLSKYAAVTLDTEALVGVPLQLTRDELETVLRPPIEATARELAATISRAGQRPGDLAAVYLAGGSSRIPLVGRVVSERLQVPAQVLGEPKNVVVAGAARWTASDRVDLSTPPLVPPTTPAEPVTRPVDDPNQTKRRDLAEELQTELVSDFDGGTPRRPFWRRPVGIAAAVALLLVLGIGTVLTITNGSGGGGDEPPRLAAPANLTTERVLDAVQLFWDAVPSATRYLVYRDGKSVAGSNHAETGFLDRPGDTTSHKYYVQAAAGAGVGRRSVTLTGKAAVTPTERRLVDRLKAGLVDASTCVSDSSPAIAAVQCGPSTAFSLPSAAIRPTKIYASRYADHGSIESARDSAIEKALARDPDTFGTECTRPPAKLDWRFSSDPETSSRGRLYCYVYTGMATLEWSYTSDAILLGADAATTDVKGLYQWWLDLDRGGLE